MKDYNEMDKMLKQMLEGTSSSLPEGLLGKILEKNRRKRNVFAWLNGGIITSLMILIVFIEHRNGDDFINSQNTHYNIESKTIGNNSSNELSKRTAANARTVNSIGNKNVKISENEEVASNNKNNKTELQQPEILDKMLAKYQAKILPKKISVQLTLEVSTPINTLNRDEVYENSKVEVYETPVIEENKSTHNAKLFSNNAELLADSNPIETLPTLAVAPALAANSAKRKLNFEVLFTMNGICDFQKLQQLDPNDKQYHKDYGHVTESGIRPATGFGMGLGFSSSLGNHVKLNAGIQYARTINKINYNYLVREVPVVDSDGEIKGYIILNDTAQFTFISNNKYAVSTVAIPLSLAYNFMLKNNFRLEVGLGINPQFRFGDQWIVPDKKDLTSIKSVKPQFAFNIPPTLSFGFYKKSGKYLYGINTKASPINIGSNIRYGGINIYRNRFEIGIVVGKIIK